jgi:hypothetical protein
VAARLPRLRGEVFRVWVNADREVGRGNVQCTEHAGRVAVAHTVCRVIRTRLWRLNHSPHAKLIGCRQGDLLRNVYHLQVHVTDDTTALDTCFQIFSIQLPRDYHARPYRANARLLLEPDKWHELVRFLERDIPTLIKEVE